MGPANRLYQIAKRPFYKIRSVQRSTRLSLLVLGIDRPLQVSLLSAPGFGGSGGGAQLLGKGDDTGDYGSPLYIYRSPTSFYMPLRRGYKTMPSLLLDFAVAKQ